ncbi:hypothetical protein OCK74_24100 [Chitinophagaceae bacterium LB-8]|uniref:Uncharacterized protein n=1 Tax=Paraflavisolibacter caeni TaxID=2982496 RepID=A0A9X2XPU7_9BACT|nr:hypothetical protein [Paraflavisolibacter caeni]MCU7552223.1 hypothetical protein [Paraflavisolibacter caeni]
MKNSIIKHFSNHFFAFVLSMGFLLLFTSSLKAQSFQLQTQYARISVNGKGYITSIKEKKTGKEYCPKGMASALMSLHNDKQYILPSKAIFNIAQKEVVITYTNGSVAKIKIDQNQNYLRFQLLSLAPRNGVENIVWGPYKTNISKTIGEIISVVRSEDFAIGILGLNDNTISGPPTESSAYYYIHSPDPKKYPLPQHLKEGQTFPIGGDGINDVAFYSQPEEYFRMNYGNGALLEPAFGSSICMHSRDRKKERMIRFPVYPEGVDPKANAPRYQLVSPVNADFIGSAIAFYACPDSLGLNTIEKIVIKEGLPHIKTDGKWIKDPAAFRPDIAWWGTHDSLASYANQLGLKSVQDEGWGEYYPNPANRWGKRKISLNGGSSMSIPEYGALMKKNGIQYGLHTLCEFLQPNNNSDVSPVPSDSLAIMLRTTITKNLSASDTIITVADTSYFNEFGGWEGNHTNVLKIGKELIEYNGITRTKPYTFLNVKRGFHGTTRGNYPAGTTIVKLQPNCYHGFAPDMNLQEVYADYYGRWLTEGGMDYIDFDGLESCLYQGHGQYSFKRFFRGLFDSYHRNGGKYLRVMGSAIGEGSWHYMSVCNVGGGDHMFSPVLNKWGIEGKDIRYAWESSYFPATFGIQNYSGDWSVYDAENLQAKSIGWNATYMLGLSQQAVENSAEKAAIFKSYRTWENARALQLFSKAHKEKLKDLNYKFHLEHNGERSFTLFTVKENRFRNLEYLPGAQPLVLQNEFEAQPLELAIRVQGAKDVIADGIRIKLDKGEELVVDKKLSSGQFIMYKNNSLYIADKNRNKLEEIKVTKPLSIEKGQSNISVQALHNANDKVKLELVVSVIGKGEKINGKSLDGKEQAFKKSGMGYAIKDNTKE